MKEFSSLCHRNSNFLSFNICFLPMFLLLLPHGNLIILIIMSLFSFLASGFVSDLETAGPNLTILSLFFQKLKISFI